VSLNYISSTAADGTSITGADTSLTNKFDNDSNQIALSPSSSCSAINSGLGGSSSDLAIGHHSSINSGVSVNHCSSSMSGGNSLTSVPECKVWKNPMSLLRGAEYSKLTLSNGKEPLTFYDMNLSAQDHQTFFTCESDEGKSEYEIMQRAWRERNPSTRVSLANEALSKSSDCTPAIILLAEEEAQTIIESEKLFKQALKYADVAYKKSLQAQEQGHNLENLHSKSLSRQALKLLKFLYFFLFY